MAQSYTNYQIAINNSENKNIKRIKSLLTVN